MSKAIKQTRIAILLRIDEWEKRRCEKCNGYVSNNQRLIHCQCQAAVEIRKLGEIYNAVAGESKKNRVQDLLNEAKENGLTLDIYRRLKESDVHNKEIQKGAGMTNVEFYEWKHAVGLIREKPQPVNGKLVVSEKYRKQAIAHGVPLNIVKRRVYKYNWEWERAVSTPVRPTTKEGTG